jgi:Tfp pilus assembly protein PilO
MSQDKDLEQENKRSGRIEVSDASNKPDFNGSDTSDILPSAIPQQLLVSRLVIAVLLLIAVGLITVFFLLKQPGDLKSKLDKLQSENTRLNDKYEQVVLLEVNISKRLDNIKKEIKEAQDLQFELESLVKSK